MTKTMKGSLWVVWIVGMLICSTIGIGGLGYSLFVRFSNPELTETQLFLRYWWCYLAILVGFFWMPAFLAEKPWKK